MSFGEVDATEFRPESVSSFGIFCGGGVEGVSALRFELSGSSLI